MTYKQWQEGLSEEAKAGENVWKAAMKEAAMVCRDQKGVGLDASKHWNPACEYCATEIEQGG